MKNFIKNSIMGLIAGLPLAASAANTPHFILFDQPFVMSQKSVRIDVEKVEEKFSEKGNSWDLVKATRSNVACGMEIRILGRDFAAQNRVIGEHYTGELAFTCDVDSRKVSFDFKRTIFLGIRNCIKSETFTDNDYCDIYAVALGEEKSLNREGGPLIRQDDKRRTFYRLTSQQAAKGITGSNLIPQGVRATTINAFQVMKLSMDKKGSELFVEKPNSYSNLQKGNNIYLTLSPQSAERDANLRKLVEADADALADILEAILASPNSKDAIVQKTADFLKMLSKATKELLAIVSPIDFIQLESALRSHEKTFEELWQKLQPETKLDESLNSRYSDLFTAYKNMKTYSTERSNNEDTNTLLKTFYDGQAVDTSAPQRRSDAPVRESTPMVGKEFIQNYNNSDAARRYALGDCNTYLEKFPLTVRSQYTCKEKKNWANSNEWYSIHVVEKLN